MDIEEIFDYCLGQVFQPETKRMFYQDQIRDLGMDISRASDDATIELTMVMLNRMADKLLGRPTQPHRLNNAAFMILTSWYFPTDHQMLAALASLREHQLTSRRLTLEFMRDAFARNILIAKQDYRDRHGVLWPAGSLVPCVRGDDRITHIELIARTTGLVEQDNMRTIPS